MGSENTPVILFEPKVFVQCRDQQLFRFISLRALEPSEQMHTRLSDEFTASLESRLNKSASQVRAINRSSVNTFTRMHNCVAGRPVRRRLPMRSFSRISGRASSLASKENTEERRRLDQCSPECTVSACRRRCRWLSYEQRSEIDCRMHAGQCKQALTLCPPDALLCEQTHAKTAPTNPGAQKSRCRALQARRKFH